MGALWLALTVTGSGDAAARPGDSAVPVAAPASMDAQAPARVLPRLVASSALLTGPAGQKLHAALTEAEASLAPNVPATDAESDAAAVADKAPVTDATAVERAAEEAGATLDLAASLASSALNAPPAQSLHLLTAAASLDDAARATLTAAHRDAPAKAGIGGVVGPGAGDAALTKAVKPALAALGCTGDAAVAAGPAATPPASASGARAGAGEPVEGFPLWQAESAALSGDAANAVQSAGAAAGRLAYASEVVDARIKTDASQALATSRGELTRALQAALPPGCAPVVTTAAGAPATFTGPDASATMLAARSAVAERLLRAAAATGGDARAELLRQWWAQRPVG